MSDPAEPTDLSNAGDADLQAAAPSELTENLQPEIASSPTAEPVHIEGDERLQPFQDGTLTKVLFGAGTRTASASSEAGG